MQANDTELDLRGLAGILKRQKRLILLTVLLITSAALLYALTATPKYRAETLILVDPKEQNLLDPNQVGSVSSAALNARVESEVEIIRSAATALSVVEAANLVADPEFGPQLSNKDKLLQAIGFDNASEPTGEQLVTAVVRRFVDARSINRRGLTYLISAGVTSQDPKRAAELANTLAETYIRNQVASKITASLAARDIIESQVAAAQERLALSEERLDSFIFDNIDRLEAESGAAAVSELRSELEALQSERRSKALLVDQTAQALEARDWAALGRDLEDAALVALESQRASLSRRLEASRDSSGEVGDLREALERAEERLEERAATRVAQLRNADGGLESQIGETRDEIRSALLQADLSSSTLAEVFALQQEAELAREQYQTLLSRLSELGAQASVQVADSRVVSVALPPNSPVSPNTRLIVAAALIGSLGLGLGLALMNEYYVGGITSEAQLSNILQQPVGGAVVEVAQEKGTASIADMVVDQPLSGYAENFRQLRASVDRSVRLAAPAVIAQQAEKAPSGGKVIMVTSSVPAEGKTTSSLALARTYALAGKPTVLIDADMRKPSLAKLLEARPTGSLMDFLMADRNAEKDLSFFTQDRKTNLQVVLGGTRATVPTDQLLSSERFSTFIREARAHSEIVIIDSPPLLPVVDARYIATHADICLLMVRSVTTSQSDVRMAGQMLRDAVNPGTPILSVLSLQEQRSKAYKYAGYYHDYTT